MQETESRERMDALTGMRGLACLCIVCFHFYCLFVDDMGLRYDAVPWMQETKYFFEYSKNAVELFFMLSGFLSVKLLDLTGGPLGAQRRQYIGGRAVRLLIPYTVMSLIYLPLKLWMNSYAIKAYELKDAWRILIGDSLTDKTMAAQVSYYDFVQKDFQCEVVNCGRSSTGYMIAPDYETFYQRIDLIDFTDADVVTIFGSFNDLGRGFAFGTAEDEGTDTIGGCMNITIEKIREKAPDIRIGIATPTPWNLGAGYDSIKDAVVYWGVSKEDCDHYVSLLMEVAARHGVPVLDLYHAGLFDPNSDTDRAQYFNENGIQDPGIHPNSMGHYLMAPLWKDFLLGLLGQKG